MSGLARPGPKAVKNTIVQHPTTSRGLSFQTLTLSDTGATYLRRVPMTPRTSLKHQYDRPYSLHPHEVMERGIIYWISNDIAYFNGLRFRRDTYKKNHRRNTNGVPWTRIHGVKFTLPRAVWQYHRGPIPEKHQVWRINPQADFNIENLEVRLRRKDPSQHVWKGKSKIVPPHETKPCEWCGKPFTKVRRDRFEQGRFCGNSCSSRYKAANRTAPKQANAHKLVTCASCCAQFVRDNEHRRKYPTYPPYYFCDAKCRDRLMNDLYTSVCGQKKAVFFAERSWNYHLKKQAQRNATVGK